MSRGPVLALALVFAGYCGLAAVLPPAEDELYYWCWAKEPQLSYYDHPPMTALLVRASTGVFGDTLWATRLPACAATAFVLGVIAHLSRPRSLVPGVVFTPLFTIGAVLVTPDTPLLLFWAAYLLWLVAVHKRLDSVPVADRGVFSQPGAGATGVEPMTPVAPAPGWDEGDLPAAGAGPGRVPPWLWAVGGVVLGCGVLGKYTTGLLVPAGFVSFLFVSGWRRWLPGYVAHGAVSFLVASPILIHNVRHDFAPLLYQWKHAMQSDKAGLRTFGEFVGVQVLLFGAMPLVLLPWAVRNVRTWAADPRLRACGCLFVVPFTFFLYKAVRGPLEGNWALACYIGFWPLAAFWYESVRHSATWRRLTAASFAVPAVCVVLLAAHLVYPTDLFGLMNPHRDRITRQGEQFRTLTRIGRELRERTDRLPVFAPSYQMTAALRFAGVPAEQVVGATRPSHFTQTPRRLADAGRVLVVGEGPLPDALVAGFGKPTVVGFYPVTVRGQTVKAYGLFLYEQPAPAGVAAGRPGANAP